MAESKCRLCKGVLLRDPLLRLKGMPEAAQYYPEKSEFKKDKGIALYVYQCSACGLVQLAIKPVGYFKEVITAASFSEKARSVRLVQMKEFVDNFGLKGKKVLEIGSGEGNLLDIMQEAGVLATGLEASAESVSTGRKSGRNMLCGYIGSMRRVKGGPFDAFVSLNYIEHLPDPGKIIRRIYENTAERAAGFVTVPNLEYLLGSKCFYEFVADHLSYFTQKTLTYAFESSGFEVKDCRLINNDNDIAVQVQKRGALDLSAQYCEVEWLIKELRRVVGEYKKSGKKVAVWGAGHRSLALLALSGLDDIDYIVDSAKFKQGKYAPVTHIRIMAPEYLLKDKAGLVIVMVPGLYPEEVLKTLARMNTGADVAVHRGNKIEFSQIP